jgi:transposase-like protein
MYNYGMSGRPTKYSPEMDKKVLEYLDTCRDYFDEETKKIKVNIPTMEGVAQHLDINRDTLFAWRQEHTTFSDSLDKIVGDQKKRLINNGLSGDYNSTIAKLILSANHGMREGTDITSDSKPISPLLVKFIDGERNGNPG